MSYQLTAWAVKQRTGSVTKKAVLLALANCANHHTNRCEPLIAEIADEVEVNERTVRRALDDLEEAGFIEREMKHNASGHRAGYVYSFPHLADTESERTESPTGHSRQRLPDTVSGQDLEVQEGQEQEDLPPPTPSPWAAVVAVWATHSPPLIRHRDAYYADRKTTDVIARKLKLYPSDVIAEAIANYATVLGGADYMWTHSWTLIDFLNRGLDRFVPEARPLENFRNRNGEKFGRRDVSAGEMLAAADRLEREQRGALPRGEG